MSEPSVISPVVKTGDEECPAGYDEEFDERRVVVTKDESAGAGLFFY